MGIEEWGIHELWRRLQGDAQQHEKTIDALRRRLDTDVNDVYLYLGNFLAIRWNFGLMGVCSIRRDVQMSLF